MSAGRRDGHVYSGPGATWPGARRTAAVDLRVRVIGMDRNARIMVFSLRPRESLFIKLEAGAANGNMKGRLRRVLAERRITAAGGTDFRRDYQVAEALFERFGCDEREGRSRRAICRFEFCHFFDKAARPMAATTSEDSRHADDIFPRTNDISDCCPSLRAGPLAYVASWCVNVAIAGHRA